MHVITEQPTPLQARRAVAAMGNFDGVHLGHQAVVAAAREQAAALAAPLAVITFEPHPRRYFHPAAPPFRLQSAAQRARCLAALGVQFLFERAFDAALASCTPEAFVREVLCEDLGVAGVVTGSDFRFGQGRRGDFAALKELGRALGIAAIAAPMQAVDGAKVSSSAIRAALAEGRVRDAAAALTRPFAIEGTVETGAQRGRSIGFPTANVALGDYQRPAFGVYAVRARIAEEAFWRPGVANIGVKPTVGGAPAPLLETHLFDFAGDLYGRTLEVALVEHLRPERRFESFAALTAQIAKDAETARAALGAVG